ncbi:MAG: HlyD family efflux transporter periplasmic adaptor subunit [Planctomycetota bacterium]
MNHDSTLLSLRGATLAIAWLSLVFGVKQSDGANIELKNLLVRLVDEVEVPARAVGALAEVSVREGSVVTEGQVLGKIDDTEVRLELERSKLETEIALRESKDDTAVRSAMKGLEYAVSEFDRLRRAKAKQFGSVSDSVLEKAQLDAEQARIEIERGKNELGAAIVRLNLSRRKQTLAERAVDLRRVVAPIEGMILEVKHQAGEWVTPGETIFRVVDTKRLRIEGYVPADKLDEIRRGQSVRITPVGGSRSVEGTVTFLSPEIDLDGKARLVAEFKNEDGLLRPGRRVDVIIKNEID